MILAVAILAVFWEAAFGWVRSLLGAQLDLLPALMVYASLRSGMPTVVLTATVGGLGFDALSANVFGVSVLPLFVIGLLIHVRRDVILKDQAFAQFILGSCASLAVPVMTLVLLLTGGKTPLTGWGTLWQLLVMSLGGGFATPVLFEMFGWLERSLIHGRVVETSFRSDREIRRGRA